VPYVSASEVVFHEQALYQVYIPVYHTGKGTASHWSTPTAASDQSARTQARSLYRSAHPRRTAGKSPSLKKNCCNCDILRLLSTLTGMYAGELPWFTVVKWQIFWNCMKNYLLNRNCSWILLGKNTFRTSQGRGEQFLGEGKLIFFRYLFSSGCDTTTKGY